MKAYSKDLRIRVIDAVDRGSPQLMVADQFMVSVRTIKRWLQRRRKTGNLAQSPRPGPPARKMGPLRTGLLAQLEAYPAATLDEHCTRWAEEHGVQVSTATMSRVITQHFGERVPPSRWTREKRPEAPANATSRPVKPGASKPPRSSRPAGSSLTSSAATSG
jgi:transposase